MSRHKRISKRRPTSEPAQSDFLRREYTKLQGLSRHEEPASISGNRPKPLDRHWSVQELNPELVDELEAAWERHYGALPPIRRLKRNVAINPFPLNLEEYDEETATEP